MSLNSIDALYDTLKSQLHAADICFENALPGPAITLVYCTIDFLASLESENPDRVTRKDYMRWVTEYLDPELKFGCTAAELYGARCGVVHTLSSQSDLSRQGKAREVVYSWGNQQNAQELEKLRKLNGRSETYFVIHANRLLDGVVKGADAFVADVNADQSRSDRVDEKMNRVLTLKRPAEYADAMASLKAYQSQSAKITELISILERQLKDCPGRLRQHLMEQMAELQDIQAYCNEVQRDD